MHGIRYLVALVVFLFSATLQDLSSAVAMPFQRLQATAILQSQADTALACAAGLSIDATPNITSATAAVPRSGPVNGGVCGGAARISPAIFMEFVALRVTERRCNRVPET